MASDAQNARDVVNDAQLRAKLEEMQEDDILKFLRDTVQRLDAATERLERLAATREVSDDAGQSSE